MNSNIIVNLSASTGTIMSICAIVVIFSNFELFKKIIKKIVFWFFFRKQKLQKKSNLSPILEHRVESSCLSIISIYLAFLPFVFYKTPTLCFFLPILVPPANNLHPPHSNYLPTPCLLFTAFTLLYPTMPPKAQAKQTNPPVCSLFSQISLSNPNPDQNFDQICSLSYTQIVYIIPPHFNNISPPNFTNL